MQVPVYLEATDRAQKLYRKLGFKKLDKGVLLSPKVTGDNDKMEAPIMVKMPTSSTESFEDWSQKKEV